MEEDIKLFPQHQGKWKNDPGAQRIAVENGPLNDRQFHILLNFKVLLRRKYTFSNIYRY